MFANNGVGVRGRGALIIRGRRKMKNPSVFSREFLIQNHGDIAACINILFLVGLMIQATSSICSKFVFIQYPLNDTDELYGRGLWDICNVTFIAIMLIAFQSISQDFILKKITRKFNFSKIKQGQLKETVHSMIMYMVSLMWAGDIILNNEFIDKMAFVLSNPTYGMSLCFKTFYIGQISYWTQGFPQLYFQRKNYSEVMIKIGIITSYFLLIVMFYIFNFTRFGVVIIFLTYAAEFVFQVLRLSNIIDETRPYKGLWQSVACLIFLIVQMTISLLTFGAFLYGFIHDDAESKDDDFHDGYFNILPFRLIVVVLICVIQAYMFYLFVLENIKLFVGLKSKIMSFQLFEYYSRTPNKKTRSRPSKKQKARLAKKLVPISEQATDLLREIIEETVWKMEIRFADGQILEFVISDENPFSDDNGQSVGEKD